MQKAALRAVVHSVMIEAVNNALLKEDQSIALVAMFVSNYVKKDLIYVTDKKEKGRLQQKISCLSQSSRTSDPSNDDDISSEKKKN